MTAISFTGPSGLTLAAETMYREHVRQLFREKLDVTRPEDYEFITGAAHGVDTVVAQEAMAMFPGAMHIIVVPAAPHNDQYVAQLAELLCLGGLSNLQIWLPSDYGAPADAPRGIAYMARNDKLVQVCDELWVLPATSDEILRSGTWATKRRAERAGRPFRIFPLDQFQHQPTTQGVPQP